MALPNAKKDLDSHLPFTYNKLNPTQGYLPEVRGRKRKNRLPQGAFFIFGGETVKNRIGVVGIFMDQREKTAPEVNKILSQHSEMISGRLGLPYRERNLYVIALIVDGTTDEIGALTGKLGAIPGVHVKSALSGGISLEPKNKSADR